mmetsp:Transcript_13038/g.43207  ORF Transcript_13038/g.43207 Transcript_13038/m.43207 type:complete len:277 (+) Transcript_13038:1229-2059(+)
MSVSVMTISMSPFESGEAMSSAVRYWLLTEPLSSTRPPGKPSASILTGGHPVPMVHSASTPSCLSPIIRSWIGRSRMRSTPSRINVPLPAAATAAVSGRIAVPALPRNSSAPSTGILPAQPTISRMLFSRSSVISRPSVWRAPTMNRMSSESSRLSTLVFPSASAERSKMRLDMDLEPGRVTTPSIFLMGSRVSLSSDPEYPGPWSLYPSAAALMLTARRTPRVDTRARGLRAEVDWASDCIAKVVCTLAKLCKDTGAPCARAELYKRHGLGPTDA